MLYTMNLVLDSVSKLATSVGRKYHCMFKNLALRNRARPGVFSANSFPLFWSMRSIHVQKNFYMLMTSNLT